jgi:hypothetical protein
MQHRIKASVLGVCLIAMAMAIVMPLSSAFGGAGALPAGAATVAPRVVAVAGCDDDYLGTNFGDTYNVRIDVDAYNLPSSADGDTDAGNDGVPDTVFFLTPAGSPLDTAQTGYPIAAENGTGAGTAYLNLVSPPYSYSITVQYKTPNGAEALLAPVIVQVPPITGCGSDGSTNVSAPPGAVSAPIVGMASIPDGGGYWMVGSDGRIYAYGDASLFSLSGSSDDFIQPNKPIVGIAVTPDGRGIWLVASDGGIFTYGDAQYYGSTGAMTLNKPIVGMASTPDGMGYWLVASDGGVFAFGDAQFYGSTGAMTLNKPIVGMAADELTGGYWLVAADGGIFSFNAPFLGSTGAMVLNKPIVGMAAAPNGTGYRFVASDGGVFCFGVPFAGSTGNITLNEPVSAMAPSGSGGYWLAAQDGGVFTFAAQFYGTPA